MTNNINNKAFFVWYQVTILLLGKKVLNNLQSRSSHQTLLSMVRNGSEIAIELHRLGAEPNTFVGLLMGEKSSCTWVCLELLDIANGL